MEKTDKEKNNVFKGPSVFLEILSLITYVLTLTRRLKVSRVWITMILKCDLWSLQDEVIQDFLHLGNLTRRPAMRSPLIDAAMTTWLDIFSLNAHFRGS